MALDILTPIRQGLATRQALQQQDLLAQQQEAAQRQNQLLGQLDFTQPLQGQEAFKQFVISDPAKAKAVMDVMKTDEVGLDAMMQDAAMALHFANIDPTGQRAMHHMQQRIMAGERLGRNMSDTKAALNTLQAQGVDAFKNEMESFLSIPQMVAGPPKGTDLKTFESLLERAGLSPDEAKQAARIKLGLDPRATGSADITIAKQDLAKEVAAVRSEIKEAEEFGKKTGVSRANAIDKGFEQVGKINNNISNINRAITLLDQGAKTGAVERFLPSVKAATVELNNLRNQLGLDVVGAVTFGALSKGELDLALDTALPTGLNEPELKAWLQRKRESQEKLRGYLEDQINFLDQGGTKAGFMRQMKRGIEQPAQPQQRSEQDILSQYGIE